MVIMNINYNNFKNHFLFSFGVCCLSNIIFPSRLVELKEKARILLNETSEIFKHLEGKIPRTEIRQLIINHNDGAVKKALAMFDKSWKTPNSSADYSIAFSSALRVATLASLILFSGVLIRKGIKKITDRFNLFPQYNENISIIAGCAFVGLTSFFLVSKDKGLVPFLIAVNAIRILLKQ